MKTFKRLMIYSKLKFKTWMF